MKGSLMKNERLVLITSLFKTYFIRSALDLSNSHIFTFQRKSEEPINFPLFRFLVVVTGIAFCLLIQIAAHAQKKHFQHLTSEEGLSQSEVYCFLEDSRGFMWIGTVHGLNRYDGYHFKVYNTDRDKPDYLNDNTIKALDEDDNGRIWIGTNGGINVYDPKKEVIKSLKLPITSKEKIIVHDIVCEGPMVMVGTSIGLLIGKSDSEDLQLTQSSFERVSILQNSFTGIKILEKDANNTIWAAFDTTLLQFIIDASTGEIKIIQQLTDQRLQGTRDIAFDKSGNIWISTFKNGVLRYSYKSQILEQFAFGGSNASIISNNPSAIESDGEGNIWVGTLDKGILFLPAKNVNDNIPSFEVIQNIPALDRSLSSNLIFSLHHSKSNLMWIGTIGSGINIYDPHRKAFDLHRIPKESVYKLSSNFIRSVYGDESGRIWIGTHSDGLYCLDRARNQYKKVGFGNQSVFHIAPSNDQLLICSSDGFSINKVENSQLLSSKSSLIKQAAFYVIKSKEDIVWIASLQGLFRGKLTDGNLEITNGWNVNSSPALSFNNCRVLLYSAYQNKLYVGTEGGGLNILRLNADHQVMDISSYKQDSTQHSLSNNNIRSITEDANHTIWVGTYEGLNKIILHEKEDRLTFQAFTTKNGLPNNMVQLLTTDENQNLWIGTNDGLCKFNTDTETFIRFSVTEGIQSNEFSEHAVFKKSDGEIIVGGVNGINTFYPDEIEFSTNLPHTVITKLFLSNTEINPESDLKGFPELEKSISLTDSLFLPAKQNNIGFEFSALVYSNPEKIQYAYMLEGFDKGWNYTDAENRRVNYTNLEYGNYTFLVKSTNNDGLWEETPTKLFFTIKTPFFYSTAAYIMYVLLIILIILYFANYSVIKITTKRQMILENEHNQQLHELDELRARFFINISHDIRTPLTLIGSPLLLILKDNKLTDEARNRLQLVYKNVEKLKYFIDQLLDISKAEAGKLSCHLQNGNFIEFLKKEIAHFTDAIKLKGLELNFNSTEEAILCRFDSDMISKILFNLISNAIKYTAKGEICVSVNIISKSEVPETNFPKSQQYIQLEIQDSGKGISKEELNKIFDRFYQGNRGEVKGYGLGLAHCKDLIEAHQGMISAVSSENEGTTFQIYIPLFEVQADKAVPQQKKSYSERFNPNLDLSYTPAGLPDDVKSHKILIIEDNADLRDFLKGELGKSFQVFTAQDGLEGLELAEKHAPELIISDIMMPNMDGIEFCEKIKSDIRTSHIPVILLTAKGDTATKYQSIEKGADDYIPKPFEMEYLIIRIKNLLRAKERIREAFQLNKEIQPASININSLDKKFMADLLTTIEEGISDPNFTITTLETMMGMSHTNLYYKIKDLTGKSAKQILMDMRMKRAKQILQDTEGIRVSEVSYRVGFTNPKYFSRVFKEYYGVLPSDLN